MRQPLSIKPYDASWAKRFETLSQRLRSALGKDALRVEHIGSTAVPGLSAKPIVDIDVVIANDTRLIDVVEGLSEIGYEHQGDLGVEGREAFELRGGSPAGLEHHLYVCRENAAELRRHIAFRDTLIARPERTAEYAALKRELAGRFADDREAYTKAKTEFIEGVLRESGNSV